jgi:predicted small metal-binding protein
MGIFNPFTFGDGPMSIQPANSAFKRLTRPTPLSRMEFNIHMETAMPRVLRCGEIMPGCTFEIRGVSDLEILARTAEHARDAHNLTEMSAEMAAKVHSAIRDEVSGHFRR